MKFLTRTRKPAGRWPGATWPSCCVHHAGVRKFLRGNSSALGVPLAVARGGFYETAEVLDLLSLLQLLDNPLQDVPCLAVLRSPLVGLTLDELAEIRLAAREKHFWTALNRSSELGIKNPETRAKISKFLERFSRWRGMVKLVSLSQCLEEVLSETFYAEWLRAQPGGAPRGRQRYRFSASGAGIRPVSAAGFVPFFEIHRGAAGGRSGAGGAGDGHRKCGATHEYSPEQGLGISRGGAGGFGEAVQRAGPARRNHLRRGIRRVSPR